jgi:predicted GNAT family N-acyltransferase
MEATAIASHLNRHVHGIQRPSQSYGIFRAATTPPPALHGLSIRVLKTAAERSVITDLRRYAPMDAERDLNADLDELEEFKDHIGMVMAIYRGGKAIATIRLVPSGHGVTLAEKTWCDVAQVKEGFGHRSWEVGRLIVAPEHRNAELLPQCLALALRELMKASDAAFLHASCSPLMARLYRRVGFSIEKIIQGEGGLQHALIHAHVEDVARALKIAPTPPDMRALAPLFVPVMQ